MPRAAPTGYGVVLGGLTREENRSLAQVTWFGVGFGALVWLSRNSSKCVFFFGSVIAILLIPLKNNETLIE